MHKGSIYTHKTFRITIGLILVILLFGFVTPALAADGGNIIITPPVTTRFPEISFFIEPFRADGTFIDDLLATQIQVEEDGKGRTVCKGHAASAPTFFDRCTIRGRLPRTAIRPHPALSIK